MGTALHGEEAGLSQGPRRRAASRGRAYAQARRHSGLVRLLRVLIPVGSVLALGLLIAAAVYNPFRRQGDVSVQAVGITGTQITMQSPRMTGQRGDNQPYEVTATVALQDVRKPNVIELRQMQARLAIDASGNRLRLTAETGVFDSGRERLDLRGNVQVETEDGQRADLASASIDFKANTVVSREPVKVTMQNGVIEADNLDITEGGQTIVFTGRVRSVFSDPNPGNAPAPQNAHPASQAPAAEAPTPPRVAAPAKPSGPSSPAAAPTRTSQAATSSRHP